MTTLHPQDSLKMLRPQRRRLTGIVVSTKMAETAVVRIDRRVAHPKYGKYYTVSTRLKVHNPAEVMSLGDFVRIEETRPLSKEKRWRYVETVKSA